ncbi:MAG: TIM barrel protein, partial [Methanosarcinales archaeon]
PTQFGTLEEILNLSMELDGILPCIDFAHLHARTGKNNTYSEFHSILSMIENNLGKESLEDMHIHVSGIEYEIRGEKRHLILKESDFNYQDLLKAWKEFDIKGLVICESPNLEGDALLLKEEYYRACENLRAEARSLKARLR